MDTHHSEPVHQVRGQSVLVQTSAKGPLFSLRCGAAHDPTKCRFQDTECHNCGKKGHIWKVCRSKTKSAQHFGQSKPVHRTQENTPDQAQEYTLYPIWDPAVMPLQTVVIVEDREVLMEVDKGASVTVISEATLGSFWGTQPSPSLQPTDVNCSHTWEQKSLWWVGWKSRSGTKARRRTYH